MDLEPKIDARDSDHEEPDGDDCNKNSPCAIPPICTSETGGMMKPIHHSHNSGAIFTDGCFTSWERIRHLVYCSRPHNVERQILRRCVDPAQVPRSPLPSISSRATTRASACCAGNVTCNVVTSGRRSNHLLCAICTALMPYMSRNKQQKTPNSKCVFRNTL